MVEGQSRRVSGEKAGTACPAVRPSSSAVTSQPLLPWRQVLAWQRSDPVMLSRCTEAQQRLPDNTFQAGEENLWLRQEPWCFVLLSKSGPFSSNQYNPGQSTQQVCNGCKWPEHPQARGMAPSTPKAPQGIPLKGLWTSKTSSFPHY